MSYFRSGDTASLRGCVQVGRLHYESLLPLSSSLNVVTFCATMSFGFSLSDVIALAELTTTAYQSWRDAPSDYAQVTTTLKSLRITLHRVHQHFHKDSAGLKWVSDEYFERQAAVRADLAQVVLGCNGTVAQLNAIAMQCKSLSGGQWRTRDRIRMATKDVNSLVAQLTPHMSILSNFLLAVEMDSIGRSMDSLPAILETALPNALKSALPVALGNLFDAVSDDKRSARDSILTTYGPDDDKRAWKDLRGHLRQAGISDADVQKHSARLMDFMQSIMSEETNGVPVNAADGEGVNSRRSGEPDPPQYSALDDAGMTYNRNDGADRNAASDQEVQTNRFPSVNVEGAERIEPSFSPDQTSQSKRFARPPVDESQKAMRPPPSAYDTYERAPSPQNYPERVWDDNPSEPRRRYRGQTKRTYLSTSLDQRYSPFNGVPSQEPLYPHIDIPNIDIGNIDIPLSSPYAPYHDVTSDVPLESTSGQHESRWQRGATQADENSRLDKKEKLPVPNSVSRAFLRYEPLRPTSKDPLLIHFVLPSGWQVLVDHVTREVRFQQHFRNGLKTHRTPSQPAAGAFKRMKWEDSNVTRHSLQQEQSCFRVVGTPFLDPDFYVDSPCQVLEWTVEMDEANPGFLNEVRRWNI